MREIKFRAYDNKLKKYVDTGEIIFSFYGDTRVQVMPNEINYGQIADYEHDINNGRFIIEQYIRKQDKNGTDVFEGDILQRYKKNGEPYKGTKIVPSIEDVNTSNIVFNESVVIGNVHEPQT